MFFILVSICGTYLRSIVMFLDKGMFPWVLTETGQLCAPILRNLEAFVIFLLFSSAFSVTTPVYNYRYCFSNTIRNLMIRNLFFKIQPNISDGVVRLYAGTELKRLS